MERQALAKDHARGRIVAAAQNLHRTAGADAVSIRAIAAAVGLTPMAIYRHFRDKDEVLEAMADAAYAMLFTYFDGIDRWKAPEARIRFVMLRYLDFALDHPARYEAFSLPRRQRRRYPDDFAVRPASSFRLLKSEIERGIHAGRFRADDPLELALTFWAHAFGLLELYRRGRFSTDALGFRAIYERAVERLLRGVLASGPRSTTSRRRPAQPKAR
jgi:AcrR family transcriptional regulator